MPGALTYVDENLNIVFCNDRFRDMYKRNANGTYFAFAKRNGKIHKQSLETTDRATANRKLKEFIENLDVTDRKFESMSLNQLLDRYLETIKGKAPSTIATRRGFIKYFRETWHLSLDVRVALVKTGDLKTWFGSSYAASLKPSSFNECLRIFHCIFDLAVADGVIARSPLRPKEISHFTTFRRAADEKDCGFIPTTRKLSGSRSDVAAIGHSLWKLSSPLRSSAFNRRSRQKSR